MHLLGYTGFYTYRLIICVTFTVYKSAAQLCLHTVENITSEENEVSKEELITLCQLPDASGDRLFSHLLKILIPMENYPVLPLLMVKKNEDDPSLENLFYNAKFYENPEVYMSLILVSKIRH